MLQRFRSNVSHSQIRNLVNHVNKWRKHVHTTVSREAPSLHARHALLKIQTVLTWIAILVRWGRRVLGVVLVGLAAADHLIKYVYLLAGVGDTTWSESSDLLHRVAAQNPRPAGELIHSLSNLRWCGHRVSNSHTRWAFRKIFFSMRFWIQSFSRDWGKTLFFSLFLHRTRKTANFPINFHILFWHLMKGSLMSNDVHNK